MKNYLLKIHLSSLTISLLFILASCALDQGISGGSSEDAGYATGTGGSLARFAITGDYLYTVDHRSMQLFDISMPSNPTAGAKIELGIGIETIFPYGDHLFIGAQDGMYTYSIAQPAQPNYISKYRHITACDPVVVQGNLAFVTLRTSSECQWAEDRLDIIDISKKSEPREIRSYNMDNPHGLGIDGSTLFVCEGNYGLKVFEVAETPQDMEEINELPLLYALDGIHAYDVIPNNGVLILTGEDGLYQFDYSVPDTLIQLSKMTIHRPV